MKRQIWLAAAVCVGIIIMVTVGNELVAGIFSGLLALVGFTKGKDKVIEHPSEPNVVEVRRRNRRLINGGFWRSETETDGDATVERQEEKEEVGGREFKDLPKHEKARVLRNVLRTRGFKELGIILTLLVANVCQAGPVCLTQDEAAQIDAALTRLQTVEEVDPNFTITKRPTFHTQGLRVTSDEPMIVTFGWDGIDYWDTTIDLGVDIEVDKPDPSWWESNDFTVGFTLGGVVVGGSAAGLLLLLNQ